jgi:hypothetical protein
MSTSKVYFHDKVSNLVIIQVVVLNRDGGYILGDTFWLSGLEDIIGIYWLDSRDAAKILQYPG